MPARKNNKYKTVTDLYDSTDEPLALTYLTGYRLLEQALVQAGFVRAAASYKQPQPDWYSWARYIEKQFDPGASEELQEAVAYLLTLWDDMEELPGRLQNRIQWESSSSYSDILWLAEMLQQTGMQLTNHCRFAGTLACDTAQVMAALMLTVEWLQLVRQ